MPGTFSPPPWVSDSDMHHDTFVTHVPWCMPGSLTNCFLWSRWPGKRSRHSRRMHNPQFCVSGKRPIERYCPSTIVVLMLSPVLCTQFPIDVILTLSNWSNREDMRGSAGANHDETRQHRVYIVWGLLCNWKSWWRHQMETFSALQAICAGNYLICAWINGWVNNREAGDLRRHRAHYDITTETSSFWDIVVLGSV